MEIITVNMENIHREHICCVISEKKGECCVASKKGWMKERFNDGLVFKKANVRGKVFIEYIPAENSWCPIIADEYMFINCLWVSGQYKGQGLANQLLEECIIDANSKGKKGLVILSSKKKMPFLSDHKYFKYKGFRIADTANPYYELLYLPFDIKGEVPRFKECVKTGNISEQSLVIHYSNQCPYTEKYINIIKDIAQEHNIKVLILKYETKEQAQNAINPFTTYSLFYNGKFVTNEILSEKKFLNFIKEKGV